MNIKLSNFCKKFILIIGFMILFLILIANITVSSYRIIHFLKCLVILGSLITFIYILSKRNIKISKKAYVILLSGALILHLILLLVSYNYPEGDSQTFYNNAVSFATSNTFVNAKYIAVFPHLGAYVLVIGFIMKLVSTKYFSFIFLNIIFNFLGSWIISKMFNNLNTSRLASLLWIYSPINLVWCSLCMPIIFFQTLFLLVIYVWEKLLTFKDNWQKYILFSLLLGLVMGIANLFRPIMIVFLIALVIYYFYLILQDKRHWQLFLISLLCIYLPYMVIGKLNNNILEHISSYPISSLPGWNLYVGSTGQNGKWNKKAGQEFNTLINDSNYLPEDIHEYFFKEALTNYQDKNVLENLIFMKNKFVFLTTNLNGLTSLRVKVQVNNPPVIILHLVDLLVLTWIFAWLILSLLSIHTQNKNPRVFFYTLLIVGITTSHLLLEVSPRYFIPAYVPMMLLGLLFLTKDNKIDVKKEVKK